MWLSAILFVMPILFDFLVEGIIFYAAACRDVSL
jgi:hypothetical protein